LPAAPSSSHRHRRLRTALPPLHAVRKGAPPPSTAGGGSDANASSGTAAGAAAAAAAALDAASAAEWVAFAEKDAPELDLLERDAPAPPGAVPPEFSAAVNLMCNRTLKARTHDARAQRASTRIFTHSRIRSSNPVL
jgi:hypothetical protein